MVIGKSYLTFYNYLYINSFLLLSIWWQTVELVETLSALDKISDSFQS